MCQFSDTALYVRQKSKRRKIEVNLEGRFLHSCFELTWIGISQGCVEGQLFYRCTSLLHLGDLLGPVKSLEGEQSVFFLHFTPERKIYTSDKFYGRTPMSNRGLSPSTRITPFLIERTSPQINTYLPIDSFT